MPVDNDKYQISYRAEPTFREFHLSDAFVRGVRGPVGTGKTTGCCWDIFIRGMNQPEFHGVRRSRWALIRNTHPELETTTLKTWMDWFEDFTKMTYTKPMKGVMEYRLPDETNVLIELIFLAMDQPKDVKKLKSLELTGAFLNEASELSREVFTKSRERCRRYPSKGRGGYSWSGVIMDTNSMADDHWWYKYAEEDCPESWRFWTQPPVFLKYRGDDLERARVKVGVELMKLSSEVPYDPGMWFVPNPIAEGVRYQSAGFDYWRELVKGEGRDYIEVYIQGNYGSIVDSKPVYPEYQDHVHCADREFGPDEGLPIVLGWDFGLMPACVFCQQHPNGQFRVFDEVSVDEHGSMGIRQFSSFVVKPYLLERYRPWVERRFIQSWGDPAGNTRSQNDELTCYYLMNGNVNRMKPDEYQKTLGAIGIKTRPARSNFFTPRRDAVARRLLMPEIADGEPAFLLSPKCTVLRSAFRGRYCYRRVQVSGDRYKDEPDKNRYSHPMDALQYAALMVTPVDGDWASDDDIRRESEKTAAHEMRKSSLSGIDLAAVRDIERVRNDISGLNDSDFSYSPWGN